MPLQVEIIKDLTCLPGTMDPRSHWNPSLKAPLNSGIYSPQNLSANHRVFMERYLQIYENAPVGYFTLSEKGIICESNSTGANLLNTRTRELPGMQFIKFVLPEFKPVFMNHCKRVIEKGTRQTCDLKLLSSQNQYFFGRLESVAEPEIANKGKRIRTTLWDITQRRRTESALEISESQQRVVTELGQLALAGEKFTALLDKALASVLDTLRLEIGEVLEWLPDCGQFSIRSAQGWKKSLVGRKRIMGGTESQSGFTLLSGKPVLVEDLQTETRFKSPLPGLSNHCVVSGVSVLIGKPGKVFGILGVHSSKKRKFKKNDIIFLQSVAHIFASVVKQEAARTVLKNSEKRLQFLSSHLLTAQEEERKKVAYMLHDDLGQSLTLLKLQISAIEMKIEKDGNGAKADCRLAMKNISKTIENVRKISHSLTPSVLKNLGLSVALQCLFEDFSRYLNVHLQIDMGDMDKQLAQESKILIYRIFQEAFTNIVRHARADQIWVCVARHNHRYRFDIQDNGTGFDLNGLQDNLKNSGMGLTAMNERVRMLGGQLRIKNRKSGGTWLWFEIPDCQGEPDP